MITVLTGERQVGKTTLCRRIVDLAMAASLDVAGILSPANFVDGHKAGINVVDLRARVSRPLATIRPSTKPGELGYTFDEEVISWANDAISSSTPCDLLVIDEIGPLEIKQNGGFVSALEVLRTGEYSMSLVVVRPKLIDAFGELLGMPFNLKQVDDFPEGILTDWPSFKDLLQADRLTF